MRDSTIETDKSKTTVSKSIPFFTDQTYLKALHERSYIDGDHFREGLKRDISIICNFLEGKILNETDMKSLNKRLEKVQEKLESLENQVAQFSLKSENFADKLHERVQTISDNTGNECTIDKIENPDYVFRIDCAILEYLARKGFIDTAELFGQKKNLLHMIDISRWKEYHQLYNSLGNKSLEDALLWCQKDIARFYDVHLSELERELHLQNVLELGNNGKQLEAFNYLKNKVPPKYIEKYDYIRRAITFITFKDSNDQLSEMASQAYPEFDYDKRWNSIIKKFFESSCSEYTWDNRKPLESLCQAGLSCIKTQDCSPELSLTCPACDSDWNSFMKELPSPHHVQSSIFCPETHQKISFDDGPYFCLSDQKVYSSKFLDEFFENAKSRNVDDYFKRLFIT